MTKDDILNMPAGFEINKLVQSFVMGGLPPVSDDLMPEFIKPFSSDISAAWEVVEKVNGMIEELGVNYNYLTLESLDSKNYAASFDSIIDDPEWYEDVTNYRYAARAETAPLAICRAVLLAIMDNKDV